MKSTTKIGQKLVKTKGRNVWKSFDEFLTFCLSNAAVYNILYFTKIGKYSVSCRAQGWKRFESHTLEYLFFFLSALLYLLFKEGLWSSEQIHNSVQLANLKSTLQTLSLWPLCGCKVDKTWGFFFGATLLFNNVTWTLTSHSRRAALGGVGRQAGPSEHEEIFLQNIGKINQNNML